MIAFVRGILAEKTPASVVIDAGGVGYELFIPLSTYDRLPATGEECKLFSYHLVREDSQTLFGFAEKAEKQMFERLVAVSGVGPKLALAVLGGLTLADLSMSIANGDAKRLSQVKGIGKRTAERIVVELRGKIDPLEAMAAKAKGGEKEDIAMLRDAILALGSLGFPEEQARKMAQQALSSGGRPANTEELLRRALAGK